MNIAQAVKKCAMEALEASIPCDVMLGTVSDEEKPEIECNKMTLTEDVLVVCDSVKYKECRFKYGSTEKRIVVNEGLKVGDEVVLLRQRGGNKYFVTGKL